MNDTKSRSPIDKIISEIEKSKEKIVVLAKAERLGIDYTPVYLTGSPRFRMMKLAATSLECAIDDIDCAISSLTAVPS